MQTTSGSGSSSNVQAVNKSMGRESASASEMLRIGGTMPEIENFRDSVQHCFDIAKTSDFLEENVALEAFDLQQKTAPVQALRERHRSFPARGKPMGLPSP